MNTFTPGQRLLIELNSKEIYDGIFISSGENRIDLIKVHEFPNSGSISHLCSFYNEEINSIIIIADNENEIQKNLFGKSIYNTILISSFTFDRLRKIACENYIYISTIDVRYYNAIEYFYKCESIGVVALSKGSSRFAILNLLIVCSIERLYIFDFQMFNLKTFPKELREVFECRDVTKVMHDSRSLVDCFFHQFNFHIENLFDTQFADYYIRKKRRKQMFEENERKKNKEEVGDVDKNIKKEEEEKFREDKKADKEENKESQNFELRNLPQCLSYYLQFPYFLTGKIFEISHKIWEERPLSSVNKCNASLLAVYLLTLKNRMQFILLDEVDKELFSLNKNLINPCILQFNI